MSGQRAAYRRRQTVFRRVVVARDRSSSSPLPLVGDARVHHPGTRRHGRTADTWAHPASTSARSTADYPALREGFIASVGLAVLTVVDHARCCWCRR